MADCDKRGGQVNNGGSRAARQDKEHFDGVDKQLGSFRPITDHNGKATELALSGRALAVTSAAPASDLEPAINRSDATAATVPTMDPNTSQHDHLGERACKRARELIPSSHEAWAGPIIRLLKESYFFVSLESNDAGGSVPDDAEIKLHVTTAIRILHCFGWAPGKLSVHAPQLVLPADIHSDSDPTDRGAWSDVRTSGATASGASSAGSELQPCAPWPFATAQQYISVLMYISYYICYVEWAEVQTTLVLGSPQSVIAFLYFCLSAQLPLEHVQETLECIQSSRGRTPDLAATFEKSFGKAFVYKRDKVDVDVVCRLTGAGRNVVKEAIRQCNGLLWHAVAAVRCGNVALVSSPSTSDFFFLPGQTKQKLLDCSLYSLARVYRNLHPDVDRVCTTTDCPESCLRDCIQQRLARAGIPISDIHGERYSEYCAADREVDVRAVMLWTDCDAATAEKSIDAYVGQQHLSLLDVISQAPGTSSLERATGTAAASAATSSTAAGNGSSSSPTTPPAESSAIECGLQPAATAASLSPCVTAPWSIAATQAASVDAAPVSFWPFATLEEYHDMLQSMSLAIYYIEWEEVQATLRRGSASSVYSFLWYIDTFLALSLSGMDAVVTCLKRRGQASELTLPWLTPRNDSTADETSEGIEPLAVNDVDVVAEIAGVARSEAAEAISEAQGLLWLAVVILRGGPVTRLDPCMSTPPLCPFEIKQVLTAECSRYWLAKIFCDLMPQPAADNAELGFADDEAQALRYFTAQLVRKTGMAEGISNGKYDDYTDLDKQQDVRVVMKWAMCDAATAEKSLNGGRNLITCLEDTICSTLILMSNPTASVVSVTDSSAIGAPEAGASSVSDSVLADPASQSSSSLTSRQAAIATAARRGTVVHSTYVAGKASVSAAAVLSPPTCAPPLRGICASSMSPPSEPSSTAPSVAPRIAPDGSDASIWPFPSTEDRDTVMAALGVCVMFVDWTELQTTLVKGGLSSKAAFIVWDTTVRKGYGTFGLGCALAMAEHPSCTPLPASPVIDAMSGRVCVYTLDQIDVDLIVSMTGCSRADAEAAIVRCGGLLWAAVVALRTGTDAFWQDPHQGGRAPVVSYWDQRQMMSESSARSCALWLFDLYVSRMEDSGRALAATIVHLEKQLGPAVVKDLRSGNLPASSAEAMERDIVVVMRHASCDLDPATNELQHLLMFSTYDVIHSIRSRGVPPSIYKPLPSLGSSGCGTAEVGGSKPSSFSAADTRKLLLYCHEELSVPWPAIVRVIERCSKPGRAVMYQNAVKLLAHRALASAGGALLNIDDFLPPFVRFLESTLGDELLLGQSRCNAPAVATFGTQPPILLTEEEQLEDRRALQETPMDTRAKVITMMVSLQQHRFDPLWVFLFLKATRWFTEHADLLLVLGVDATYLHTLAAPREAAPPLGTTETPSDPGSSAPMAAASESSALRPTSAPAVLPASTPSPPSFGDVDYAAPEPERVLPKPDVIVDGRELFIRTHREWLPTAWSSLSPAVHHHGDASGQPSGAGHLQTGALTDAHRAGTALRSFLYASQLQYLCEIEPDKTDHYHWRDFTKSCEVRCMAFSEEALAAAAEIQRLEIGGKPPQRAHRIFAPCYFERMAGPPGPVQLNQAVPCFIMWVPLQSGCLGWDISNQHTILPTNEEPYGAVLLQYTVEQLEPEVKITASISPIILSTSLLPPLLPASAAEGQRGCWPPASAFRPDAATALPDLLRSNGVPLSRHLDRRLLPASWLDLERSKPWRNKEKPKKERATLFARWQVAAMAGQMFDVLIRADSDEYASNNSVYNIHSMRRHLSHGHTGTESLNRPCSHCLHESEFLAVQQTTSVIASFTVSARAVPQPSAATAGFDPSKTDAALPAAEIIAGPAIPEKFRVAACYVEYPVSAIPAAVIGKEVAVMRVWAPVCFVKPEMGRAWDRTQKRMMTITGDEYVRCVRTVTVFEAPDTADGFSASIRWRVEDQAGEFSPPISKPPAAPVRKGGEATGMVGAPAQSQPQDKYAAARSLTPLSHWLSSPANIPPLCTCKKRTCNVCISWKELLIVLRRLQSSTDGATTISGSDAYELLQACVMVSVNKWKGDASQEDKRRFFTHIVAKHVGKHCNLHDSSKDGASFTPSAFLYSVLAPFAVCAAVVTRTSSGNDGYVDNETIVFEWLTSPGETDHETRGLELVDAVAEDSETIWAEKRRSDAFHEIAIAYALFASCFDDILWNCDCAQLDPATHTANSMQSVMELVVLTLMEQRAGCGLYVEDEDSDTASTSSGGGAGAATAITATTSPADTQEPVSTTSNTKVHADAAGASAGDLSNPVTASSAAVASAASDSTAAVVSTTTAVAAAAASVGLERQQALPPVAAAAAPAVAVSAHVAAVPVPVVATQSVASALPSASDAWASFVASVSESDGSSSRVRVDAAHLPSITVDDDEDADDEGGIDGDMQRAAQTGTDGIDGGGVAFAGAGGTDADAELAQPLAHGAILNEFDLVAAVIPEHLRRRVDADGRDAATGGSVTVPSRPSAPLLIPAVSQLMEKARLAQAPSSQSSTTVTNAALKSILPPEAALLVAPTLPKLAVDDSRVWDSDDAQLASGANGDIVGSTHIHHQPTEIMNVADIEADLPSTIAPTAVSGSQSVWDSLKAKLTRASGGGGSSIDAGAPPSPSSLSAVAAASAPLPTSTSQQEPTPSLLQALAPIPVLPASGVHDALFPLFPLQEVQSVPPQQLDMAPLHAQWHGVMQAAAQRVQAMGPQAQQLPNPMLTIMQMMVAGQLGMMAMPGSFIPSTASVATPLTNPLSAVPPAAGSAVFVASAASSAPLLDHAAAVPPVVSSSAALPSDPSFDRLRAFRSLWDSAPTSASSASTADAAQPNPRLHLTSSATLSDTDDWAWLRSEIGNAAVANEAEATVERSRVQVVKATAATSRGSVVDASEPGCVSVQTDVSLGPRIAIGVSSASAMVGACADVETGVGTGLPARGSGKRQPAPEVAALQLKVESLEARVAHLSSLEPKVTAFEAAFVAMQAELAEMRQHAGSARNGACTSAHPAAPKV